MLLFRRKKCKSQSWGQEALKLKIMRKDKLGRVRRKIWDRLAQERSAQGMAQVEDAGDTEQAHGTDRPIRGSIEVTERLEKRQFGRFFGSYIRSKDSATVMHRVEKTLLKSKAT